MDGNFKIILLSIFYLLFSCSKADKKTDFEKIVLTNKYVFLDSLDFFDKSKLPLRTDKYKNLYKYDSFDIELLDSVYILKSDLNLCYSETINKFKIKKKNFILINFKITNSNLTFRKRKILLKHELSSESTHLKVIISNFLINQEENLVSFQVTKYRGKASKDEVFFFKKINNKWIYVGKRLLFIG